LALYSRSVDKKTQILTIQHGGGRHLEKSTEGLPWDDLRNFLVEVAGGQGNKWLRNIPENFNCLSRAHERYRQTTDRQTDGR